MTSSEKHSTMYWIVSALITLASTGMCFFLGAFAEVPYGIEDSTGVGWIAGLILGFGAAIAYLFTIEKKRSCPIFSAHFLMYATLTGTGAGTAAALILHIALMIAYNTFEPLIIAIGIGFGVAAGSILGIIAAALLKKAYNIKGPAPQENTD